MSTLPCNRKLVVFVVAASVLCFSTPLTQAITGEQLTLTPQTLNYGNIAVGSHLNQMVTMTNSGTTTITITGRVKNAPEFWLNRIKFPVTLSPGRSLRFGINFQPTVAGPASGTFALVSNTSNSYVVNVSGTGVLGLAANPASINFGSVQVGIQQSTSEVLTNASATSLTISQASVTGAGFGITGLTAPVSLNPGQNFTFTVTFKPQSSGALSGSIVLNLKSGSSLTIPLAGGGAATGQLTVSPASANFGTVTVGTSKSMPATLTATGASVTINSGSLINSEFSVSGLSLPLTLAAGQSASFTLSFSPNTSGTATGNTSFVSNAVNSPAQQSLSGIGSVPVAHSVSLSWTPNSPPVAGYNVYRGAASTGPFARINSTLDATAAYSDSNVQSGQTYYYVVTAVNSSGLESSYSSAVQAVIP